MYECITYAGAISVAALGMLVPFQHIFSKAALLEWHITTAQTGYNTIVPLLRGESQIGL